MLRPRGNLCEDVLKSAKHKASRSRIGGVDPGHPLPCPSRPSPPGQSTHKMQGAAISSSPGRTLRKTASDVSPTPQSEGFKSADHDAKLEKETKMLDGSPCSSCGPAEVHSRKLKSQTHAHAHDWTTTRPNPVSHARKQTPREHR